MTTPEEMRAIVTDIVYAHQGLKTVDLSMKVMEKINPSVFDTQDYAYVVNQLVHDGIVIELTIGLPTGRVIRMFFPNGTKLTVKGS